MHRPLVSLALISGLSIVLSACQGMGAEQAVEVQPAAAFTAPARTPEQRASDALQVYLTRLGRSDTPSVQQAHPDLDGDGRNDLLMLLLEGEQGCASASCTMLVFRNEPKQYRLVNEVQQVRAPIAVSPRITQGWHDLLVHIDDNGFEAGTVALQFNGTQYPSDPSLLAMLAPDRIPLADTAIASR